MSARKIFTISACRPLHEGMLHILPIPMVQLRSIRKQTHSIWKRHVLVRFKVDLGNIMCPFGVNLQHPYKDRVQNVLTTWGECQSSFPNQTSATSHRIHLSSRPYINNYFHDEYNNILNTGQLFKFVRPTGGDLT